MKAALLVCPLVDCWVALMAVRLAASTAVGKVGKLVGVMAERWVALRVALMAERSVDQMELPWVEWTAAYSVALKAVCLVASKVG